MKALKKSLKYFGILVLVVLVALISTPFIFKGKLIEITKKQINEQVNAKIEFDEFDLSIFRTFPNLLFEINNVKVSGIGNFEKDTLLNMEKLSAKVDIMSVMSENIKIIGISIDNMKVNAIVLADSSANWDITKESATETAQTTTEQESGNFNLNLKSFEINNSDINYTDNTSDMSAKINGLTFALSGDLGAETTTLSIKSLIKELTFKQEGVNLINKAQTEYNADIKADMVNSKYTFDKNMLKLNNLELAFEGFVQLMENEDINLDIKFNTKKTDFKSLLSLIPVVYTKDYEKVKTNGNFELNGFAKGIYGETLMPAYNVNLKVADAMFKYPDLPASATNIQIDLNINNKDGQEDNTIVDLKKFHVELAGNPIDLKLLTKTPISDPYIDGNIIAKIDFDKLKTVVPLEDMEMKGMLNSDVSFNGNISTIEQEKYEEFKAQGTIILTNFLYKTTDFDKEVLITNAELEFTPKYLSLNKFVTKIGKTDISATGQIHNFLSYYFKDDLLKGDFTINSTLIDLNEFMSETDQTTTQTAQPTSTQQAEQQESSVIEIPKNIDFNLSTNITKLLYDKYVIENVLGKISMKEGIASMDNLKMNMLDGSLNLSGNYSTADITKPSVKFAMDLVNFDIKKSYETIDMIKESAPIAKNCSGKFSMKFDFESLLDDSLSPVMKTVNGGGELSSKNITIDNSDIFKKLSGLLNNDKYKNIQLADLKIKFKIKDGNIEVEPFNTKAGKTEFEIGGKQGIDQSLDFKINLKIPRSEIGAQANQLVNGLSALAGANGVNINLNEIININGLITGTIQDPKISLDLKSQAKDAIQDVKEQVKEKVKEEVDKAKKQAIEEAKKQAEKIINEATAQAENIKKTAQQTATTVRSEGKKSADLIRSEAVKQGDNLIKQAGANPIKKAVAKESAKQIKIEADKKAANVEAEANKKANNIVTEANKQADNVIKTAKTKADKLIKDAENA